MKKILLLSCVAFMFACSNEGQVNNETSNVEVKTIATVPVVENGIDQMFYDYVNSTIYLELKQKVIDFNDKVQAPSGVSFKTRSSLLNWIGLNLSHTQFTSVSEAEFLFDELVTLTEAEQIQFSNIYDFLISAPDLESRFYFRKWVSGIPYSTFSTCREQLNDCRVAADAAFKLEIKDISASQNSNKTELETCAKLAHQNASDACDTKFDDCVKKYMN